MRFTRISSLHITVGLSSLIGLESLYISSIFTMFTHMWALISLLPYESVDKMLATTTLLVISKLASG